MNPIQLKEARDALFNDPELGAGNFLFKARAAHDSPKEDYLFLEQPYIGPRGTVHTAFSLDSLHGMVRDLAGWYRQQGVEAGQHLCLFLGDGIPSFLHFLALGSIGCVPALVNGHLNAAIAALYAQRNRFGVLVYDKETAARWNLPAALEGVATLDAGFTAGVPQALAALPASGWPVPVKDEDTVMVCHSSGTTGIPKAVLFGHAQFFNGKRERLRTFAELDEERLATAMPPTHAAGISYLMTATMLQFPTLALSTQTGEAAARAIADFQPTIVTAFSQTYASFAELGLPDGYLRSVRRFYNTADTAHEAHIRQLLRLAPQARFTDMFGASELGMSQFFKVSTPENVARRRIVGAPASYAQCAVLAPDGSVLPDGQPGYIGVRSPTLTPGYYGQPHLTALTMLNGFWLTGDIGLRLDNGEFVHLDRIVDVASTALGVPAYTLLLEEHLLCHREIFDASVVAVPRGPTREDAVLILVRGARGSTLRAADVIGHALSCYPFSGRAALPDYTLCAAVLADGFSLPAGSTGKVLKRVVRDQFWSWQRDYDDGQRQAIGELCWNQSAPGAPAAPAQPHSLLAYLHA